MQSLSKQCEGCGKTFYNNPQCQTSNSKTWLAKRFCTIPCANTYLRETNTFINCVFCNKSFKTYESKVRLNAKYCSNSCKYKHFKIIRKGEDDKQWKGDYVSYSGLHRWIRKHKGRPDYCEHCGSTDKDTYNWANVDNQYRRNLDDYISLCVKCHRKYDFTHFKSSSLSARERLLKRQQEKYQLDHTQAS